MQHSHYFPELGIANGSGAETEESGVSCFHKEILNLRFGKWHRTHVQEPHQVSLGSLGQQTVVEAKCRKKRKKSLQCLINM